MIESITRILHVFHVYCWGPGFADCVVQLFPERHGLIRAHNGQLGLAEQGRARAKAAISPQSVDRPRNRADNTSRAAVSDEICLDNKAAC
jgi:hypothetical protein